MALHRYNQAEVNTPKLFLFDYYYYYYFFG